jgi:hypothetical protein
VRAPRHRPPPCVCDETLGERRERVIFAVINPTGADARVAARLSRAPRALRRPARLKSA